MDSGESIKIGEVDNLPVLVTSAQDQELPRNRPKGVKLDDIIELASNNPALTDQQIATILGCERSNITKRLKPYKPHLAQFKTFDGDRVKLLQLKQMLILQSIKDKDIKKASLVQKTTAAAILIDKEHQITGKGGGPQVAIQFNWGTPPEGPGE